MVRLSIGVTLILYVNQGRAGSSTVVPRHMTPTAAFVARGIDLSVTEERAHAQQELDDIKIEREKLQRSLRKAVQMLNEERESVRKMQITVEVIQQELVDTVSELRRERDARLRAEDSVSRLRVTSATPRSVRFDEVPPSPQQAQAQTSASTSSSGSVFDRCSHCDLRQRGLDAATSGGDVASKVAAELVQQRVALERVLCAVVFGDQQPEDASSFVTALLSTRAVHVCCCVLSLTRR